MNKTIIDSLFYGGISALGRHVTHSPEHIKLNRKIEEERRYFIGKMSVDDCQRFEAFNNLDAQANSFGELDSFSYGLRLGTMLMCEIFLSEGSSPART